MKIYLFLLFLLSNIQALEFQHSKNSVTGLSRAYGFILGQEFSLERINNEYPELSASVVFVKANFDASFPSIRLKFKNQLISVLGEKGFEETETALNTKIQTTLMNQKITKDIAQNFLLEVKARAEGKIESPVLESLLSMKYLTYPANEFYDGYRQRFNTNGHQKAQKLDIALQLPKSWKAQEGERPHILQKWVSQNGTGLEMIHLDIRDADGYSPTDSDIELLVSSGSIKDMVPRGATYLNSNVFSLEMQKGYQIEMTMIQERVGISVYQHMNISQFFFHGKAIGLMCQTSNTIENKSKADEAFKEIKPLCQQVLNSIVLMQAY